MCASLSISTSTTYRREDQGAHWTRRFKTGLERLMALRETLPPDRVIDVRYADTVSDPVGVAERLMVAMGLELDAADSVAMRACIADNVRDNRPPHKYSADQFGLTPEGIAHDFAFYHRSYL
jgi:hypothetical protein